MKKEEILRASQFIDTARRDLGLNLELQDVRLGRLKFKSEEKQKFNGYVCFFAVFPDNKAEDGEKWNKICYLNAFEGGIGQSVAWAIEGEEVVIFQEFKPNDTFRAKGSVEWYYGVDTEEDDYQIVEEEFRRWRKLAEAHEKAECMREKKLTAQLKKGLPL